MFFGEVDHPARRLGTACFIDDDDVVLPGELIIEGQITVAAKPKLEQVARRAGTFQVAIGEDEGIPIDGEFVRVR